MERGMAYVINEPCIGTKDNSCVEVCPVDCIHPTPDEPDYDEVEMLYIDPEECIDCDACVEACPGRRHHPRGHGATQLAALHRAQRRLLPRTPVMMGILTHGARSHAPRD
jgi:NAD-dependent dihydropyrimidine dehydrogenase PreA subunit